MAEGPPRPLTRLIVLAKPRAKVSRIVRVNGLTVEVAIAAVPADGAANAELIAVLAKALGLPKRDLSLVRGASSRHKAVEVANLTEAEVADRLGR